MGQVYIDHLNNSDIRELTTKLNSTEIADLTTAIDRGYTEIAVPYIFQNLHPFTGKLYIISNMLEKNYDLPSKLAHYISYII